MTTTYIITEDATTTASEGFELIPALKETSVDCCCGVIAVENDNGATFTSNDTDAGEGHPEEAPESHTKKRDSPEPAPDDAPDVKRVQIGNGSDEVVLADAPTEPAIDAHMTQDEPAAKTESTDVPTESMPADKLSISKVYVEA
jgi:hypothetical protein